MKRNDLIRLLQKNGWEIEEGRGRHSKAKHPEKSQTIPIPQHKEINEFTAKNILKMSEEE